MQRFVESPVSNVKARCLQQLVRDVLESMMTYKTLDHTNRRWATGKYRGFLGRYKRHAGGLYIDSWTSRKDVRLILDAFNQLPPALAQLAAQFELTCSTSAYPWTAAGNSSTIYGDWHASNPKYVSPHIEFGRRSVEELLVPHFVHEVGHLFWKTAPLEIRLHYIEFLKKTMKSGDREVTEYCDDHFREYVRYVSQLDTTRDAEARKTVAGHYLDTWVEESFCETVACLRVAGYPDYPWASTVDFERRRETIADTLGLRVERVA